MLYLARMNTGQNEAKRNYDVVIVGAGPSGTSAALVLSDKGYKVALLDKAVFPRDKICGDALSPDVIHQLRRIAPAVVDDITRADTGELISELRAFSPNGKRASFKFRQKKNTEGFLVSRMDLDDSMVREVKTRAGIDLIESCEVKEISRMESGLNIETSQGGLHARLVIGCDGNHSLVAKQLAGRKQIDRKHHCGALRCYYENVSWPEGHSHIELHFLKNYTSGYLWVFPMTRNRANVGIGMLSDDISRKKLNLKEIMQAELSTNPLLASRFENARPLETVKGFGIPIGSRKYPLSGDGFLLCGDAACLVDPLTGEGIANAVRSGRFAAEYAAQALAAGRTDAAFLKAYDKKIYSLVGDELRLSRFMQRCFRSVRVLNFTVGLAQSSKSYSRLIHFLFEDTLFYSQWSKPSFYLKLVGFKGK